MLRIVGAALTAFLLAACAPTTLSSGPSAGHLRTESVVQTPGVIPQPVQQIASLPRPRATGKTETYSVVVNNVKVQDLLFALARDAKLNVDIHSGISGYVSLNAIDQTLPQLLTRIAKQVDMRFELDGPNLAVMPDTPYLKSYKIDYINMARDVTGTVSTNTQISTSALSTASGGGAGVGGGGGGNVSRIQIENKSRNRFWESLEKNLKDLLHETDKIFPEGSTETVVEQNTTQSTSGTGAPTPVVSAPRSSRAGPTLAGSPNPAEIQNSGATLVKRMTFREAASVISSPESGVITVRATSRQHDKVQEFIDRVMGSARRQVLIEATIVEVELSDGYQQGIEWSRLRDDGSGFSIKKPTLGSNVTNAVTPFVFTYLNKSNPLNLLTTVNLLQSFGTLKVLSSPKLTVLNNQTATLKVSEDYVYFSVKSDVAAGTLGTGPTKATTTTPQSVSIGFFMSLTAQISDNDTVTLNVRPSISSISDLKKDPNPDISIENLVPQIRTREIESMMRIDSGDIAVLGGLMEDRMDTKDGRVPGFGSIPLFGELFNNRSNASKKTELVIFIRPTVIKDASISGDFSNFANSLPGKDFFAPAQVFQPFSVPEQRPEPFK
ncbi:secretin N-terminal domain-containing protein [Propionivibrio sp.]|uniref:type II secretion system protein GspD n=1 Tax=Propionivibrio sp. TaxID=2212460 RepID=UPI00262F09A8|nr:secretin N-terminal domain-containing protein [Propionivibrio sp.]